MVFNLRIDLNQIQFWAGKYPVKTDKLVEDYAPQIQERGYYRKAELLEFCLWKTPRSRSLVAQNSSEYIEAVTRIALESPFERLRIEMLTLLHGVGWPTASVLLHFGHQDPYPILDFRALWSLGIDKSPTYNFKFWWAYTQYCRNLADLAKVSMRVLDRALWQFSADNQNVST